MRLAGTSLDVVVAKFQGINRDALHRHMHQHLDEEDKAALIGDIPFKELAVRAAEEGSSVLDYLGIVRGVVMRQLLGAAAASDRVGTASLASRAVEVLKEVGRLTGEIASLTHLTQVNNVAIFNSPQFTELESMLIERLAKYPDALAAVVDGLRELETRSTPEGLANGLGRPPAAIECVVRQ